MDEEPNKLEIYVKRATITLAVLTLIVSFVVTIYLKFNK